MDEKVFREAYHSVYDRVLPDADSIEKIMARAMEEELGPEMTQECKINRKPWARQRQNRWHRKGALPAAAALLFVCILFAASLPVLASHIPAVYRMLERYVPDIADYIVPEEPECANQGVIMRVEGIQLEGNHAEIIVSFGNQEGYHHIKGKVDMYDSYNLVSHEGVGTIGGCFFLTYDEVEEKAYFKIDMTADQDFDREKLTFRVGELLTTMGQEKRDIDLSEIEYDVPMKEVEERGGRGDIQIVYGGGDSMGHVQVVDDLSAAECTADDFTLTGIAYQDGVLRVQMCMGDNTNADRHVQLFLTDAVGNERQNDDWVSWNEDMGETRYAFYEFSFLIEERELENAEMYGIFHNAEESVKGDWKVTFRLGESYVN